MYGRFKGVAVRTISTIAMAAFIAGCSTAQPTIQTGPDAQVSYDGLHLVDNSRLKQAWVDPDIDFTRYNKIMGGGSVFQFRAAKKTPTSTSMANSGSARKTGYGWPRKSTQFSMRNWRRSLVSRSPTPRETTC
jgi:hypothetical protein